MPYPSCVQRSRTNSCPISSWCASCLVASLAVADKHRKARDERAEVLEIIGEVRGKTAVIVDD